MKLTWETQEVRYGSPPEVCYAGLIAVGSAVRAMGSRGDAPKYAANVLLPGLAITRTSEYFPTAEEAKARVEKAVHAWFAKTTLPREIDQK
jgi:hypothetical protein